MNRIVKIIAPALAITAFVGLGNWQLEDAQAFTHTGAAWASPTATYFVNPSFTDSTAGTPAQQIAVMQRSASEWKSAGQIPFQFLYGGTSSLTTVAPNDGTNVVFYSGADGSGALAVTTYSFFQNGDLVGFDMEFFGLAGTFDFVWARDPQPGSSVEFDMESVGVHEFGHALGMGHSTDPTATMFPSVAPATTDYRDLAADDIAGVQALYGTSATGNPSVTQISPSFGWIGGGDRITITGSDLAGSDPQAVTFDGIQATDVTVIDDGTIECDLPMGVSSGLVSVEVSHAQGSQDNVDAFFNTSVRMVSPLSTSAPAQIELLFPADGNLSYGAAPCLFFLPGTPVSDFGDPSDTRVVPINQDPLFQAFRQGMFPNIFMNFSGTLDAGGAGMMTVVVPNDPSYVGFNMFFTALTLDSQELSGIKNISNAEVSTIQP